MTDEASAPRPAEPDPYDLQRFVTAQGGGAFEQALAEVHRGRKTTHWMWFVLPQVAGLGSSAMARRYAVASLGEARAYHEHPVLGPRLVAIAQAAGHSPVPSAEQLFGGIDAVKLRSSMTLFLRAVPAEPEFRAVLDRYFDGRPDPATDRLLGIGDP